MWLPKYRRLGFFKDLPSFSLTVYSCLGHHSTLRTGAECTRYHLVGRRARGRPPTKAAKLANFWLVIGLFFSIGAAKWFF